jgi:predicted nucleotide-binding protein
MGVVGEVKARAKSLPSGNVGLQIRLQRLRARHGQPLLATLRDRISKADIVVADLADDADTAWNPNVLLEVGMALGFGKEEAGALFILKPEKMKNIADINGLLLTKYRPTAAGSPLNLLDKAGFTAAVRTRLLEVARERGMIGYPISPEIDADE